MVNVNYLIRKFIIPVLFFLYILFLLWEHKNISADRKGFSSKLQDVVLNFDKIDGIILGGSNTYFGLSARKLSQELESNWVNLSLLNEGYSDNNYNDFISQTISKPKRESVSYVVLGTLTIYRKGRIELREKTELNLIGKKPFNLLPERNLAGFLKSIITNKEKSIYPIPDNYGDFNFDEFNCIISTKSIKHMTEDVDIIEKSLSKRFSEIHNLFPNAKILLEIPSLIKGVSNDPVNRLIFFNNLKEIIKKEQLSLGIDIELVSEVPFYNTDYVCDSYHHANKLGRRLRTDNLISYLK